MSDSKPERESLPKRGSDWETLRARMVELGQGDVDWRRARTAVYVFNAGEDVLRVAKEAYALYQSENALGPGAFPSLKRMEEAVVGMGLSLLGVAVFLFALFRIRARRKARCSLTASSIS